MRGPLKRVLGWTSESGLGPYPPIYVGEWSCEECHSKHTFETCPLCGSWIGFSYGLAGGSVGLLHYCCNEHSCEWWYKVLDMEGDE